MTSHRSGGAGKHQADASGAMLLAIEQRRPGPPGVGRRTSVAAGRVDLARPTLVMVIPSGQSTIRPTELVRVVLRLTICAGGELATPKATASPLVGSLNAYCAMRSLSGRQRQVLELYVVGNNDKEI